MMEFICALFWIALGLIYVAGWLIVKIFEYFLIPVCKWIGATVAEGYHGLTVWHHRVTWRQRMERDRERTIKQLDAVRRTHVVQARAETEAIERQRRLLEQVKVRTSDRTAAVPPADPPVGRAA